MTREKNVPKITKNKQPNERANVRTGGTNENKQTDKSAKQMGKIVRFHRCMNAESIGKRVANIYWMNVCCWIAIYVRACVFIHQLYVFDEMQMHWNDMVHDPYGMVWFMFFLAVLLLSERYSYSHAAFFPFPSAIIVGKADVNMFMSVFVCERASERTHVHV